MTPSAPRVIEHDARSERSSSSEANSASTCASSSLSVQAGMPCRSPANTQGAPSRSSPLGSLPAPQPLPFSTRQGIT